jgi:hypothetical protein
MIAPFGLYYEFKRSTPGTSKLQVLTHHSSANSEII